MHKNADPLAPWTGDDINTLILIHLIRKTSDCRHRITLPFQKLGTQHPKILIVTAELVGFVKEKL